MADELAIIAARAANASVQPRRSAAPPEARAVTRSHATLSMQPAPKLVDEHEAKSASSVARSATLLEPAARSTRSRWTWIAAAAVASVALGVVLAGQLREGGATPKQTEIEPLPSATAAARVAEPVVVPTPALPVAAPPGSSAEPATTSTTSAMPTAATPRRAAPRPAPQPGRSSAPPQPTVDPKFGLPVKTSP
jgi:hypothetical protein